MTFTATPEPNNAPPRVRLDLDTDNPTLSFAGLTITRDGKPIREQPFSGSSVALAYDYEAPFGTPLTYAAKGVVAGVSTVYTTAWPNLTGWTTGAGSPGVTGGKFYSTLSGSSVYRAIAGISTGRITIGAGMIGPSIVRVQTSAAYVITVQVSPTTATLAYGGGLAVAFGLGSGPVVVTFDESKAVVATTAGTWLANRGATPFVPLGLYVNAANTSGRVPGITVAETLAGVPFSDTEVTSLDVDQTWLIHPSAPSLSCAIDHGTQSGARSLNFIEASSGESKSSAAQSTIHRPVGRRRAVVITSGPRQADEWTLVVGAPTIASKNDVRAIVDDQTPLLLRSPADCPSDLPDDWYSVGDVQVQRVESPVLTTETLITLPLTPVDEPIVRQGALWTYGSDLLANPTYADSRAAFPTYLDRLAGV